MASQPQALTPPAERPPAGAERILLISPVRNEEEHIEAVARGLLEQHRRPDLWLVVDDDSSDATPAILDRLAREIPFLKVVRTPPGFTRDTGDRNAAGGPDRAFNFGIEAADWHSFDYLGKLDGDVALPPDYLEGMLARFRADPSLGVAGGAVIEPGPSGWREMRTPADHATPQARIYRRDCFEDIGGMPARMGADVITTMYAKMRGYRTQTFSELPFRHLRPMATADGVRQGRMRQGTYQYLVHYHPLWILLRAFLVSVRFRPLGLSGWWFLLGYLKAVLGPDSPVDDPELRAFVREDQRRRALAPVRKLIRRGPSAPPPAEGRLDRAVTVARRLEAHGVQVDWRGPDPYEGMNATRLVGPLKRSPMGRRVLLQAVKRSPLDLRPILGIEPTLNSATTAFVVSAYARGGFIERREADERLHHSVERLLELRSPRFEESCWGYRFATQSRVFFYDRNEPNVVATSFAAMALMDAYERLGDPELLEMADDAARFLLLRVPQTPDEPGAYFGYLVGDRTPIHNSNLHVCAVLARVGAARGEDAYLAAARRGVEWTLERQRADGSWPYGERPNLDWVDNFHTGYVLDSLRDCAEAGVHPGIEGAWRRGLAYWRSELFLRDGTPKYYDRKTYPIDGQCVAQAILTLARAAEHDPSCLESAGRTFDWALQHMRRRDGLFYFQRRAHWVNRTPHLRWVQAPMLLALTRLVAAERARGG
jgi:glycosyltransferase involved in cell wall biosynthesis